MRLLLLTDSHGRGMPEELLQHDDTLRIHHILIGGKLSEIRGEYRRCLSEILQFRPTTILIHCGHNDVNYDEGRNPYPKYHRVVVHQLREMVTECNVNHPRARVFVSSLLPRVYGYRYSMEDSLRYNRLAKRFGELVKNAARLQDPRFVYVLNGRVWADMSIGEPKPMYYKPDGLHLNPMGMYHLGSSWYEAICNQ
jgi:lysophospholipase L1-like esterase